MRPIIIAAIVVVVLLLGCVGAGAVGLFIFAGQFGPPDGAVIDVNAPKTLEVGQEAQIVVTIENQLDESRELLDIDIYEPLFGGIEIVSIEPEAAFTDGNFGIYTASMNTTIGPLDTLVVTLTIRGTQPGYHSGDVDVSIDDLFRFESTFITIDVVEPTESAPDAGAAPESP